MIEKLIEQYVELGAKKAAIEKERGIITPLGSVPESIEGLDPDDELAITITQMRNLIDEYRSYSERVDQGMVSSVATRLQLKIEDLKRTIVQLEARKKTADAQIDSCSDENLKNRYEDIVQSCKASISSNKRSLPYYTFFLADLQARLEEMKKDKTSKGML